MNNKVLFNNEEKFSYITSNSNLNNINNQKLSNIDISNFENPKRIVKSKAISENKTKSNNFVSPKQSSCLNRNNLKIALISTNKISQNVTPSNKSTASKDSTDIFFTKERSKEPDRDQITSSTHSAVPSINSNQEHEKEPIGQISKLVIRDMKI